MFVMKNSRAKRYEVKYSKLASQPILLQRQLLLPVLVCPRRFQCLSFFLMRAEYSPVQLASQSSTEEDFRCFLFLSLMPSLLFGHVPFGDGHGFSIYTEFLDFVFIILKAINSLRELEITFRKLLLQCRLRLILNLVKHYPAD